MTKLEASKAINDSVREELATEYSRKTSFETRAFSTVTANLTLVTLGLALSQALRLWGAMGLGLSAWALGFAALLCLASVLSAVAAAYPRVQEGMDAEFLSGAADYLDGDIEASDVYPGMIRARVRLLRTWRRANDERSRWSILSFWLLSVWPIVAVLAGLLSSI